MSAPARTFSVRNVQFARALVAAAAAVMITFSPDHSSAVGLSVFSGFAFVTAFLLALAAGMVMTAGHRWPYVLMAAFGFLLGMGGGVPQWRTPELFFVLVITWAALTGLVELLSGLRARREGDETARDAITVGVLGLLLAVLLLIVAFAFRDVDYAIEGAGNFTLTPITVGVGLFGGYAAIVAVFLGIAGLSPKPVHKLAATEAVVETNQGDAAATASSDRGGR